MHVSKLLAAAAIAMVATASAVSAQTVQNCTSASAAFPGSCAQVTNLSVTVPAVARMTFSAVSTNLTVPAAADFGTAAGVNTTGPTILVESNVGYKLTVTAPTNFTGGSTNKPSSDLTFSVDGGAAKTLGSTVASSTGASAPTTPIAIGYNTKYNWTVDTPGTYTLALTYTLTAP